MPLRTGLCAIHLCEPCVVAADAAASEAALRKALDEARAKLDANKTELARLREHSATPIARIADVHGAGGFFDWIAEGDDRESVIGTLLYAAPVRTEAALAAARAEGEAAGMRRAAGICREQAEAADLTSNRFYMEYQEQRSNEWGHRKAQARECARLIEEAAKGGKEEGKWK